MSFTYTRDIPDPPSSPSVDVPNMKVNTNSIDSIWAVDHQTFADTNAGTHLKVSLTNTTDTITPTLPTGILGGGFETLYSQPAGVTPLGPLGEIFYSRGGGPGIQLTGPGVPTKLTNGYTFLAGGIILQWGQVLSTSSSGVVNFVPAFPNAVFNITFGMIVTPTSTTTHAGQVYVKQTPTLTTSSFGWRQADLSSDAVGFFWMAIGY